MKKKDPGVSTSRRDFFKGSATLIPLTALTLQNPVSALASPPPAAHDEDRGRALDNYVPQYFNASEWEFLLAACDRLIPSDDVGPGALDLDVPVFIDRHMQTGYASGEIWYTEGPFIEAGPQFGYQGPLCVKEILRVGIAAFERHCADEVGQRFKDLDAEKQEALLKQAEGGKLAFKDISSKDFFAQLLSEVRLGYFSDPQYGGNRNMGSWKMIGYPGVRADYMDWVEVRDKPYPFAPVNMAGKRG